MGTDELIGKLNKILIIQKHKSKYSVDSVLYKCRCTHVPVIKSYLVANSLSKSFSSFSSYSFTH